MNPAAHQVARSFVNQAMAGQGIFAGKCMGNDVDLIVPTVAGTGMASMQMRLVINREVLGLQGRQALAQQIDGIGAHAGRTFLNGLTLTLA